jgi:hypothetical protein
MREASTQRLTPEPGTTPVVAATALVHDRAVELPEDESYLRDALLVRFFTLGSRDELETIVRAHPELLERDVEKSLDRIVAGMADSSAAEALRWPRRRGIRVLRKGEPAHYVACLLQDRGLI